MKRKINLCPCMSLQKGCRVLAMFDGVIEAITIGLCILGLIWYFSNNDDEDHDDETGERVGIGTLIVQLIIALLRLRLAFQLYHGAARRDATIIRRWLIVSIISTIVNTIIFVVRTSVSSSLVWVSVSSSLISILYSLFEILVVMAFHGELKRDIAMQPYIPEPESRSGEGPPPYSVTNPNVSTIPTVPSQDFPGEFQMAQYTTVNLSDSAPAPVHVIITTNNTTI